MVSEVPLMKGHLTLKMSSAQVVETSVTNNSAFKNYSHPGDHTTQTKRTHDCLCLRRLSNVDLSGYLRGSVTVHHAGVHICVQVVIYTF